MKLVNYFELIDSLTWLRVDDAVYNDVMRSINECTEFYIDSDEAIISSKHILGEQLEKELDNCIGCGTGYNDYCKECMIKDMKETIMYRIKKLDDFINGGNK